MVIFKEYRSIKNFLHRFTILQIGKLHIRIHRIKSADKTSMLHNHPFHYISIILKGGYIENLRTNDGNIITKKYKAPNILFRTNKQFHRIESIYNNTITLFITYGKYSWNIINQHKSEIPDGVYQRTVNNKLVYAKRVNGIWFIGNSDEKIAEQETRNSIYQA